MSFGAEAAPDRVAPGPAIGASEGVQLGEIFRTLWRRRLTIAMVVVGFTVAGVIILKLLTPVFQSLAIIVTGEQQPQLVNLTNAPTLPESAMQVASEADILKSAQLSNELVQKFDLVKDDEFYDGAAAFKNNWLTRINVASRLPGPLRSKLWSVPPDPALFSPDQMQYLTMSKVNKSLDVATNSKSNTVMLTFSSYDPVKANLLVNGFAEQYLQDQINEKFESSQRQAEYVNTRLADLRQRVTEADRAVIEYREAHNITDLPSSPTQTEESTLTVTQLQSLSNTLADARTRRAQAEATVRELQQLLNDPTRQLSAPADAISPIVQSLHLQEAQAMAHMAELRANYGPQHPAVRDAQGQLTELQNRLKQEVVHAVEGLTTTARQAASEEGNLQGRVNQLEKSNQTVTRDSLKLRQLESEQHAAHQVFDAFVTGASNAAVDSGTPTPSSRLVSRGQVTVWPTFPNMLIMAPLLAFIATLISLGVVYVQESREDVYRNPEELEAATRTPILGLVPLAGMRGRGRRHPSMRAVENPVSQLAEAIRSVRTALAFSQPDHAPRTVMVTSAIPNEGKTSFSIMLGRVTAMAGRKVLLIEAELRRPSLARDLGMKVDQGVLEVLDGEATLADAVRIDPVTGLHLLAATRSSRMALDLLGSSEMRTLIEQAAQDYDLIILDTPPITVVSDALMLSGMIDTAILAVEWGRTPRRLVGEAIKKLRSAKTPLAGIVMTQVDTRKFATYGLGQHSSDYARSYFSAS